MKTQGKQKKLTRALSALLFGAALISLLSVAGTTLAKYIASTQGENVAVAAPFYFESDTLGEPDGEGNYPYIQISDPGPGGSASIQFTLSNYVDQLRRTDKAINYTLAAKTGSLTAEAFPGGEAISWSGPADGSLEAGADRVNNVSMTVSQESFGSAKVITVTATSSAPYQETIGARFGFDPQEYSLQWTVTDSGNAVVVEVAGGSGGTVEVTWAPELYPDLSNKAFEGAVSGKASFTAASGVRYALTFLKSDPTKTYGKDSFTVTAVS